MTRPLPHFASPKDALQAHWRLYVYEAVELAAFMLSACLFTIFLFHPTFVQMTHLRNPWVARALMGLAMGLTAILIIKSPWGQRSGAHFNPAISVTFFRLGKIGFYDTVFYVVAHFVGGIAGVGLSAALASRYIAAPQVNYAVTVPGLGGTPAAFAAETFMAVLLMTVVLYTSNRPRLAPYTTWCMGMLIASYIVLFAPVSGFSINPARTVGSAVFAHVYTALWVYFVAPLSGMLTAAESYRRLLPLHRHKPYFAHRHLVAPADASKA